MADRPWKQSYGRDLPDLDPKEFEVDALSMFREALKENASRTALIFMDVPVTFAELDKYSDQFARMLVEQGFQPKDVVGINLPNIPEYVIAWLGTMKAGCISSGVSPLLSPEEMEHQLKDCGARGLVTLDVIFAERVTRIAGACPDLELVVAASVGGFLPKIKQFLGKLLKKLPSAPVTPIAGKTVLKFGDVLSTYRPEAPDVSAAPEDTAYLMYTGGTTGLPKGAVITHSNVAAEIKLAVYYMNWAQGAGSVISAFPMFHIAGLVFCSISVYCGWTQLLVPDPRNVDFFSQAADKYKPWMICNVPSMFYMLMANDKFRQLDHSTVQQCISAAAPFPVDSQKEFESIVGRGKLIELYGMTETTAISIMNPSAGEKRLGTVGLPLPNLEVRLVDPTSGEDVGPGQPGEIWIKGPVVMKEYYKRPEETASSLTDDGYMKTGDVAVMSEDGYFTLVDRTKDMIIVSGYKVFSKKVEDIMADHPAVEIMATVGVDNPDRPGSELVRAYVVVSPGYDYDNEEKLKQDIMAFAKDKLAPYEAPKQIEIVDEMPLTSVGKLDKKALRAQARQG